MRPGKPPLSEAGFCDLDWPLMISSMVMREYSSSTGPTGLGGLEA